MSTFSTDEVPLQSEVGDRIRDHVRSDLDNEVGGVLIGTLDDGRAEIRQALPALEAVGGAAQLTFTHDVWENLLSTVDREHPDLQIVGWYHSHPGHGIFLSSYDQFIHENFFSAPGMVALVVDPRDDYAFGWFGWRDGALTRLGSDLPVDLPDRAEVPREVAASSVAAASADRRAEQIRDGAIIFLAVLLVFAMGTWFGKRPLRTENQRLAASIAQERDRADQVQTTLAGGLRDVCAGLRAATEDEVGAAQESTVSPAATETPTTEPTEPRSTEPAEPPAPNPIETALATCERYFPAQPVKAENPDPGPSPSPSPSPSPQESTP